MRERADVRKAVVADADAVGRLHMAVWQAAYAGQLPAEFLSSLREETWIERRREALRAPRAGVATLVLEIGRELVGFSASGPSRDADDDAAATGEIYAIYLYPRVWGRGLGRLLLERSVSAIAAPGRASTTLWVLASNERARRFYEAAEFVPDGGRKPLRIGGVELPEIRYRRTAEGAAG